MDGDVNYTNTYRLGDQSLLHVWEDNRASKKIYGNKLINLNPSFSNGIKVSFGDNSSSETDFSLPARKNQFQKRNYHQMKLLFHLKRTDSNWWVYYHIFSLKPCYPPIHEVNFGLLIGRYLYNLHLHPIRIGWRCKLYKYLPIRRPKFTSCMGG